MPYEEIEEVPQSAESYPGSILRNLVAGGEKLALKGGLLIPDVLHGIANLGLRGANAISQLESKEYPQLKKKGAEIKQLPFRAPSELVHEYATKPIIEKVAGKGYLEPKTPTEETAHDVLETASMFLSNPVRGIKPFAKSLVKGGAIGSAAETAKWLNEELGGPKWLGEGIKAGTILAGNLLGNQVGLEDQATKLYESAKTGIPEKASIPSSALLPKLNKLEKQMNTGDLTPGKKFTLERIGNIKDKINPQTRTIPAAEVWQFKKDQNTLFKERGTPEESKAYLGELIDILKDAFNSGKSQYPEAAEALASADEIWKTARQGTWFKETLNKFLDPDELKSPITKLALFYDPAKAVGLGAASLVARPIYNNLEIFFRSKAARKLYFKTLKETALGNGKDAAKYAKALDKVLLKEQPKEEASGVYEEVEEI